MKNNETVTNRHESVTDRNQLDVKEKNIFDTIMTMLSDHENELISTNMDGQLVKRSSLHILEKVIYNYINLSIYHPSLDSDSVYQQSLKLLDHLTVDVQHYLLIAKEKSNEQQ